MIINNTEKKNLEIDLLLQAINKCYGYNLDLYKRQTIERKLDDFVLQKDLNNISELIPLVLADEQLFLQLMSNVSVVMTDFFRNPKHFSELKNIVIPFLKTFPFINIWSAGCATGEEAYTMAIIMEEEGMLERCQIYATDIHDKSLEIAKKGVYLTKDIKNYTANYNQYGGINSLSKYYVTDSEHSKVKERIKERILFANHNLITDGVFSQMHLILCRNVLIYFKNELQEKVLSLFQRSLENGGYLFLGENESLNAKSNSDFELINNFARIYKKTRK